MKIPHQTFRQRDVDRLLSGGTPEDESLFRLLPFVRALKGAGACVPSQAQVDHFAAQAARMASPSRRTTAAGANTGTALRPKAFRPTPKLVGGFVALVLMLSASAGVAYAADGAAPGDTLYGLDCALEDLGIGDGGLPESLLEASKQVERGQVEEGLTLAAKALVEDGAGDEDARAASEALLAAAAAVSGNENAQSADVRAQVAQKLSFMATTELTGKEFGQAASALARGLLVEDGSGAGEDTATTSIQPEDTTDTTANDKTKDTKDKTTDTKDKTKDTKDKTK